MSRIQHKSIFKQCLTALNSQFFFSPRQVDILRLKMPNLSNYLPIRKILKFKPFPRFLVICEAKTVSSRIWTQLGVYISYINNHYTMNTIMAALYNHFRIPQNGLFWWWIFSCKINLSWGRIKSPMRCAYSACKWCTIILKQLLPKISETRKMCRQKMKLFLKRTSLNIMFLYIFNHSVHKKRKRFA